MDSHVVACSCKKRLAELVYRLPLFPPKYTQVAQKTHFKATGSVPRGQNVTITQTYPVFHWLIGCYNNEWTSLNLR